MTIRPLLQVPLTLSDPDDTIPIVDYGAAVGALAGLMGWNTAHPDFLTMDGSNRVSALADRSNNGGTFAQATSGAQPLYSASQINGQGALTFARSRGDRMAWGGTFPTGPSGHHSKVVVVKGTGVVGAGTQHNILSSGAGGEDGKHWLLRAANATGNAQIAVDSGAGQQISAINPLPNDTWALLIGSFTAGSGRVSLSVNGTVVQAADTDAQVAVSSLYLGGFQSTGGELDGQVAEIMIFNIDLHDASNQAALKIVKGYVAATYGLSLP